MAGDRIISRHGKPTEIQDYGKRTLKKMILKATLKIIFLLVVPIICSGSVWSSKPLTEIVDLASEIGIVEIKKAEVHTILDSKEVIFCGNIYKAEWIDSFTNATGTVEFVSAESLEINSQYLVYLAENSPPPYQLRKIHSAQPGDRLKVESQVESCRKKFPLLSTFQDTTSKYLNEKHVAKVLRTGRWVKYRQFFYTEFEVIRIYPEVYNIDGGIIQRERFISEFSDEYKHQIIRTAGYALLGFSAVEWYEYRARVEELIRLKKLKQ